MKRSGQVIRTAAGLLGIRLARYFSSRHMSALERDQFVCSEVDLLRTTIQRERYGTGSEEHVEEVGKVEAVFLWPRASIAGPRVLT